MTETWGTGHNEREADSQWPEGPSGVGAPMGDEPAGRAGPGRQAASNGAPPSGWDQAWRPGTWPTGPGGGWPGPGPDWPPGPSDWGKAGGSFQHNGPWAARDAYYPWPVPKVQARQRSVLWRVTTTALVTGALGLSLISAGLIGYSAAGSVAPAPLRVAVPAVGSSGAAGNGAAGNGGPLSGGGRTGGFGNETSPAIGGSSPAGPMAPAQSALSAVAAKVDPAVVDINVVFGDQGAYGAGTGVVLTSDGLVLTNNHVIEGATTISVTDIGNGRTYDGHVLGYDPSADIALVKLQGASGLATATLGTSPEPTVGEQVVTIGNAGGAGGSPTVSGGQLTNLDQKITANNDLTGSSEALSGLLQVSANVQPGDSGGPLVDTTGHVIGIDTAAASGFTFQGAVNQGYAVPIGTAMAVVHRVLSGRGSASVHIGAAGYLGVYISATGQLPASAGTTPSAFGTVAGADVTGVVPGGPAAAAGLGAGDVVTGLGGADVRSAAGLTKAMVAYHPGDKVSVSWAGPDGRTHRTEVTLVGGPPA